ncbi:unannotated protein [freshwater metagenome]|uniref:Unannotated protein n=1 Tax=freshwater metagenome TaxID=449393 RepID=A0A6J7D219_9ZZZZ|nr:PqqD family peptide modification chaperone [Actinomycetota bacterium]
MMPFADEVVRSGFVPIPGASVVAAYLDDEAVLYDTSSRHSALLNRTSMVIWSGCDGRATVSEICARVARLFSLPSTAVEADVEAAIRRFGESGFLHGVDPAPEMVPPDS